MQVTANDLERLAIFPELVIVNLKISSMSLIEIKQILNPLEEY